MLIRNTIKFGSAIFMAGTIAIIATTGVFAHNGNGANAQCRPDRTAHEAALAEALNVTVEELQTAHDTSDRTTPVWETLGISEDAFLAAQQTVHKAELAQAVTDGCLTQAQADERLAKMELAALSHSIFGHDEHQAVIAKLLGISAEELESKITAGSDPRQLLTDAGLTRAEVQTAVQTARTDAINQAVKSGEISQAQADELLAMPEKGGPGGHGGNGGNGGRRGGGHGGGRGGNGQGNAMPNGTVTPQPSVNGNNG
jgi:DNA-directed RNA polymerase specialized sigma subunit